MRRKHCARRLLQHVRVRGQTHPGNAHANASSNPAPATSRGADAKQDASSSGASGWTDWFAIATAAGSIVCEGSACLISGIGSELHRTRLRRHGRGRWLLRHVRYAANRSYCANDLGPAFGQGLWAGVEGERVVVNRNGNDRRPSFAHNGDPCRWRGRQSTNPNDAEHLEPRRAGCGVGAHCAHDRGRPDLGSHVRREDRKRPR